MKIRSFILCIIIAISFHTYLLSATGSETDDKALERSQQEKERCKWNQTNQHKANEIISKWMQDNAWSNPYIFFLDDKKPFQNSTYCTANIWNAETNVFFYFNTIGSTIEMVGFEKKQKSNK